MKLNKKEFKIWLHALYSGEYVQTRGTLQDEKGFCCLGVGCDILVPENAFKTKNGEGFLMGGLPIAQINAPLWLKQISSDFYMRADSNLTVLNDLHGFTFPEIADCLYMVYTLKILG